MAGNPLSAGSLATYMAASLPRNVDTQLRNPHDAIALLCHAGMIAVGFRLIGLGEDHRIPAQSDATDANPLPAEWNAQTSFAFRYAHSQSSMEYLIKVDKLGTKAVVFGIGLGDEKTTSFDVTVKDYISESSLPFSYVAGDQASDDPGELLRKIQDIFISAGRIADLGALLKINLIQKLMPGLQKEGYEDSSSSTTGATSSASRPPPIPGREPASHEDRPRPDLLPDPARPHPLHDPLAQPPRRPWPAGELPPPGFEDEYEINRPPRGYPPGLGGRNPLNIGENDLYPPGLGPHDPLRPALGPGGLPRPGGGGGMHPTFDDPLFGGREGHQDPRHPPGARYDPVGPGDEPFGRTGGPRFPGAGGGGGARGGPPNPFGGFGSNDFI
ncbi:MAG: hypothetical protein M1817_005501 [Caeruleum heppii]|nr:MAG: hypothetical protein M1817_005501 [Caeruleum heppii]